MSIVQSLDCLQTAGSVGQQDNKIDPRLFVVVLLSASARSTVSRSLLPVARTAGDEPSGWLAISFRRLLARKRRRQTDDASVDGQPSATECSIGHREPRRTRTRGTPGDRLAASQVARGVRARGVSVLSLALLFRFRFSYFSPLLSALSPQSAP